MATRKTGSRLLVVDGVTYRWRIRKRATHSQADYGCGTLHVAVELAEQPGTVLVLHTDRPHPADWNTRQVVPVRPADVVGWVREALTAGWVPSQPGSQFILHSVGGPSPEEAEPGAAPDTAG
ncbi:MAG TPA: hypothetical protein VGE74_10260 [Gemmata sp.]